MKIIVDRFEGDFAIVELEDKIFIDMPLELIPDGACEGDIITIEIDHEETERLKTEKQKKYLSLWD